MPKISKNLIFSKQNELDVLRPSSVPIRKQINNKIIKKSSKMFAITGFSHAQIASNCGRRVYACVKKMYSRAQLNASCDILNTAHELSLLIAAGELLAIFCVRPSSSSSSYRNNHCRAIHIDFWIIYEKVRVQHIYLLLHISRNYCVIWFMEFNGKKKTLIEFYFFFIKDNGCKISH